MRKIGTSAAAMVVVAGASFGIAASASAEEQGTVVPSVVGPQPVRVLPQNANIRQGFLPHLVEQLTRINADAIGGSGMVKGQRPAFDARQMHIGSVTNQADFQRFQPWPGTHSGAQARALFGVDGTGVRIGVISDSWDANGGAAAGIASGDLPGAGNPNGFTTPVTVLNDAPSGIDEGRAMIELIHDLAPGAEIFFHSAFNNPGSLDGTIGFAIDALRNAGCDIIVDDVAILTQPVYQDGFQANAYDTAFLAGIPGFSSAGNSGTEAWEGVYNPQDFGGTTAHNFDIDNNEGGDELLDVSIPGNGGSLRLLLFWEQAYPTVGAPGNASDFDLRVFFNGNEIASSLGDQGNGDDPFEFISLTNNGGSDAVVGIRVEPFGVVDPNVRFYIAVNDSGVIVDDDDTNSRTVVGGPAANGVFGVAAARYDSFSTEGFSSVGPSLVTFDHAGNVINENRAKPDITGSNGNNTTFFGFDYENDGFPNFFGTSAAAPNVAAVAALGIQYARDNFGIDLTPDQVYEALSMSAAPYGAAINAGAGLVQAPNYIQYIIANFEPAFCDADLTTTNTNPGDAGYGASDGVTDGADIAFYVEQWINSQPIADVTTTNTNPGDAGYGSPDGAVDGADIAFYVELWLGCQ